MFATIRDFHELKTSTFSMLEGAPINVCEEKSAFGVNCNDQIDSNDSPPGNNQQRAYD
eukprot:CAMPEP_0181347746 /NCGR_PEP_ID=MMETSP1101-20121128/34041_1 /TAXON_ID=46948 /ORGANISM="Rhodomonas abbreviata, Strain Caron Lab Isolate" /LENGTH=57 /DNA_ID=CAMNT_0023459977 /DNA_START=42 /DNA_END=215 /DNA_ORIENTATION=-